ncbi:MAG: thiamine phosphate synthase [Campylobacter sp.]|nr:thiamine phosphate synthase [Campylobacter sp.]
MSEIYALTDDFYTPLNSIEDQVKEILDCGIKMVQFRSKKRVINENIISNLIRICDDYNANLMINDHVHLAKKLGAHGVHIGKEDSDIKTARQILGVEKIVGISCYDSLKLALDAEENGASYVAFASSFSSTTKPEAVFLDENKFISFKQNLKVKTCLIGGINASNIDQILKLKPDYIAIVSAIYKPNTITKNLKTLLNTIKRTK